MRYFKTNVSTGNGTRQEQIEKLKSELIAADAVVIGAGSGLSTSAGFTYSGERFEKYFFDFAKKFGIQDMYSGGFYPFPDRETFWAWWSRHIWVNRYMDVPKPVYDELFRLVRDKDYFVITTNVDHCFQKAGFERRRMFYTQGDYGLFQCSVPCHQSTYDNEETVRKMVEAQGYVIDENNDLTVPDGVTLKMSVEADLIPHCPVCGKPMTMNLRSDNTFVEDEGWHIHAEYYSKFLQKHQSLKTVFLEVGIGGNTPAIIKYVFQNLTAENPLATYACVNYGEAYAPKEIEDRSIVINGDAGEIISNLLQ